MNAIAPVEIEETFLRLPGNERNAIISHGAALRLSELRHRLFLAESKVHYFGAKYGLRLTELETTGLPDDANYEAHEDYIMWQHWNAVASETKANIAVLEKIAQYGLYWDVSPDAGI